jgi:hypothetical protein
VHVTTRAPFAVSLLLVLLLVAIAAAVYYWLRWRIELRRGGVSGSAGRVGRGRRRGRQEPRIVYVLESPKCDDDDADEVDGYVGVGVDLGFLDGLDPGLWGL